MADIKISALPVTTTVNDPDIFVLNQSGTTKTASKQNVLSGVIKDTTALTGDLSGSLNVTGATVAKLRGKALSTATPTTGQVLTWNGTEWTPLAASTGGSGGGGVLFYLNYGTAPQSPSPVLTGALVKQLGRTADIAGTSYTSPILTINTWTDICGFVSNVSDPSLEFIPAGIFDLNIWCCGSANPSAPTSLRVIINKWDGTTATPIATSGEIIVPSGTVAVQSLVSFVVPQIDVALTDRLYFVVQVRSTANNHTVTANFGGSTPTHMHTTIPSIGGTGLVKVVDGVLSNPASLLVNSDVSATAAISSSKISGLSQFMLDLAATSNQVGTGGSGASPDTFTYSVNTAIQIDSVTLAVGSTVLFTAQTDARQNGPWIVTAGDPGVTPATLTRPSWFSGSVQNGIVTSIGQGSTVYGTVYTLSNTTSGQISVGTSSVRATVMQALTSAAPLSIDKGGTGASTTQGAVAAVGGTQSAVARSSSSLALAFYGNLTGTSIAAGLAEFTYVTASSPLVPGMSISAAGFQTAVVSSVDAVNKIVTMTSPATATSSGTVTVYNVTTTTLVTNSTTVIDGRTLVLNDVVFLNQTATAQSGPWVVTGVGGGAVSLTRPSWFTGVAANTVLVQVASGNSGNGLFAASINTATKSIGIDPVTVTSMVAAPLLNPAGTYGSTSQIPSLTVNNLGQVTAVSTVSVPSAITEVFVSSGNWTKPNGAKLVVFDVIAGGGGGGAGGKVASGSAVFGGAGGGGGGYSVVSYAGSDLIDESYAVAIGGGGTGSIFGGAIATTGGTSTITGTTLGVIARATGGGLGANGTATTGTAGGAGTFTSNTGGGGNITGTGGGGSGSNRAPASGAAGGGCSTAPAAFNGGIGGSNVLFSLAGGSGGGGSSVANGGNGGNGNLKTGLSSALLTGSGGGGGGASIFATGSGGNGGNGSGYGCGGGGGGSTTGNGNGGNGGNGAPGIVLVTTYF